MEHGLRQRSHGLDGRWFLTLTVRGRVHARIARTRSRSIADGREGCGGLTPINVVRRQDPIAITVDNDSEFVRRAMDARAYAGDVRLDFIAGQTGRECLHRKLQWQVARRMTQQPRLRVRRPKRSLFEPGVKITICPPAKRLAGSNAVIRTSHYIRLASEGGRSRPPARSGGTGVITEPTDAIRSIVVSTVT